MPRKSPNTKVSTRMNAPSAKGQVIKDTTFRFKTMAGPSKYPGSIRLQGHEYLSAISTSSGTTGFNILALLINPQNFSNTRLRQYGQLYDKYLFTKLVFHYTSAQPTSTTGQYILAYDRDPADSVPPASSAGVSQYFTMLNSKISNVWEDTDISCPLSDLQDFYYTSNSGYESRLTYQGQFFMASVSGTTFIGSVWVEYDVIFFDPQLEGTFNSLTSLSSVSSSTYGSHFSTLIKVPQNYDVFNTLETGQTTNSDTGMGLIKQTGGSIWTGITFLVLPPGAYYFALYLPDCSAANNFAHFDMTWLEVKKANRVSLTALLMDGANDVSSKMGVHTTVSTSNLILLNGGSAKLSGGDFDTAVVNMFINVPDSLGTLAMAMGAANNTGADTFDTDNYGQGDRPSLLVIPTVSQMFTVFDGIKPSPLDLSSKQPRSVLSSDKEESSTQRLGRESEKMNSDDMGVHSIKLVDQGARSPNQAREFLSRTQILQKESGCCDLCSRISCTCTGGPYFRIHS